MLPFRGGSGKTADIVELSLKWLDTISSHLGERNFTGRLVSFHLLHFLPAYAPLWSLKLILAFVVVTVAGKALLLGFVLWYQLKLVYKCVFVYSSHLLFVSIVQSILFSLKMLNYIFTCNLNDCLQISLWRRLIKAS